LLVSAAVATRTVTATSGRGHGAVAATAALASVALGVAILARWESGVVWAIALAAAAYAAGLELGGGSLDEWAPMTAAGLVAAAELGQWAIELHRPAVVDAGIMRLRGATIVALAAAGACAGWLMLLASNAGSDGLALTAAGLLAAAAAMVLVSRLARGT
jgi:hypothetical protein